MSSVNSKKDKHKENHKAYQNQLAEYSIIKEKSSKQQERKKRHMHIRKIFH